MRFKKVFVIILMLISVSCSKVVEYELPYDGDKIVVNGILWANELISISVTKSANPTGTIADDLALNDAVVEIYENGNYLETLVLDNNGTYKSKVGFMPIEGSEYSFIVSVQGFETVKSVPVKIPPKPIVNLNRVTQNPYLNDVEGVQVGLIIKDPENESNFYQISAHGSLIENGDWLLTEYYLLGISYDAPPPCFNSNNLGELYIDTCENGKELNFTLNISNEHFTPNGSFSYDKMSVPVANISRSFYDYLLEFERITGIELIFFNPEILPSNVEGGYGFVGSGNREIFEILL